MSASIIIASWNDQDRLKKCLATVKSDTTFDGEVIVVDDCPSELTEEIAADVLYYKTKGNCGPATAWNVGLSFSSYERVIVLNSDTEVYDGFFHDYTFHYNKIGDCILGPSGNLIDQRLRINVLDHTLKNDGYHHIPVDYVGGFCMMFNRKQMMRLGISFDEGYRLYYEDTDFCTQAMLRDVPVIFLNPKLLPIVHHGSGATSHLATAQEIMYNSRRRFVSKWRKFYRRREPRELQKVRC